MYKLPTINCNIIQYSLIFYIYTIHIDIVHTNSFFKKVKTIVILYFVFAYFFFNTNISKEYKQII